MVRLERATCHVQRARRFQDSKEGTEVTEILAFRSHLELLWISWARGGPTIHMFGMRTKINEVG